MLCVAEFSIWTREAGAGGLSIAVEGPSKAEIAFEDRKDGSSGVSYIVQEPGEGRDGERLNGWQLSMCSTFWSGVFCSTWYCYTFIPFCIRVLFLLIEKSNKLM